MAARAVDPGVAGGCWGRPALAREPWGLAGACSKLWLVLHLETENSCAQHTSLRGPPLPPAQAVAAGRWVLIEDINLAPAEVLAALVPLLERRRLHIAARAEVVEAAPGFQLLATVTCGPGGAAAGAYGSSQAVKDLLGGLFHHVAGEQGGASGPAGAAAGEQGVRMVVGHRGCLAPPWPQRTWVPLCGWACWGSWRALLWLCGWAATPMPLLQQRPLRRLVLMPAPCSLTACSGAALWR